MTSGTLLAIGVVAVLALAARRFLAGYPRRATPPRCLSAREIATVAAAAQATFPRGGAIQPSGLDAGIPDHVDRFVAAQQPAMRLLMRLLFVLIEHATLVFPASGRGGRRRFSSLAEPQQVEVLDGWRTSRLFPRRLVFTSLRAILTMGYFADPNVLRTLNLAPREIPPRVCEADLLWPPVGRPRTSIARAAHEVTSCGEPALPPLGPSGALHRDFAAGAAPVSAAGEGAA
jgi:hypothetical protein